MNKDGKLKVEGDEVKSEKYFDLFLNIDISKNSLLHLIRSFRHGNLAEVTILKEQLISIKGAYSVNTIHTKKNSGVDFKNLFSSKILVESKLDDLA